MCDFMKCLIKFMIFIYFALLNILSHFYIIKKSQSPRLDRLRSPVLVYFKVPSHRNANGKISQLIV